MKHHTATDLSNRLSEVLLNDTWIANTNWLDQLHRTSFATAVTRVSDFNTIAALTYHINYYLAGLLEVFGGGDLTIRDQYSFDLQPIEAEADWKEMIQCFTTNARAFVELVRNMTNQDLAANFVKPQYGTNRRNIEGLIEHSYYHLGQVVLMRKWIDSKQSKHIVTSS